MSVSLVFFAFFRGYSFIQFALIVNVPLSLTRPLATLSPSDGERAGCTAIELSPAAGAHWQALNLNPNRNLARLRFLEIKSKITIKIGKKPFPLNSMAVPQGRAPG